MGSAAPIHVVCVRARVYVARAAGGGGRQGFDLVVRVVLCLPIFPFPRFMNQTPRSRNMSTSAAVFLPAPSSALMAVAHDVACSGDSATFRETRAKKMTEKRHHKCYNFTLSLQL